MHERRASRTASETASRTTNDETDDGTVRTRTAGVPTPAGPAGPATSGSERPDDVNPTPPPGDEADPGESRPEQPALTVAAVARRLGVAPATLRTWDRRYGLGPGAHSAGSHRRYSAADVERLLVMRRLTLDGVAPGDAARLALATPGPGESPVPARPAVVTPIAVVDAAIAGDAARCERLLALDGPLDGQAVVRWWTELVEPAVADLGRRTQVDRPGVDAARLVHSAALAALRALPAPAAGSAVVLVVVPSGQERPPLAHALAGALAAHGLDARVVGGRVDPRHAVELVMMTRPVAAVTVLPAHGGDPAAIGAVAQAYPDLTQLVSVPDELAAQVPFGPSVHRARSFAGLVHEVLALAP